ncbi:hypothetical protein DPMN_172880 [Dreissena polymorpha]|uniref:Uncharacterized protein n=1 Tax=Dreissena polymorpha TaxID=45954 RepID=A0A9D4E1N5_DREPO|nr:hypothetical protein DPMN_172880 [Dreissena polymorpha]
MPRPIGYHDFQANIIIFELIQDIIETNLLTKFHEDWTINVASRVLTKKNSPPHVAMFLKQQKIIGTNLQTKFHDDWKINVTSRVLTSGHAFLPIRTIFKLNCHIQKTNCSHPPSCGHVFSPIWTIFELVQEINKNNLLTNFHDDWAKMKTAPPTGGHVYQHTGNTFELNQDIT